MLPTCLFGVEWAFIGVNKSVTPLSQKTVWKSRVITYSLLNRTQLVATVGIEPTNTRVWTERCSLWATSLYKGGVRGFKYYYLVSAPSRRTFVGHLLYATTVNSRVAGRESKTRTQTNGFGDRCANHWHQFPILIGARSRIRTDPICLEGRNASRWHHTRI